MRRSFNVDVAKLINSHFFYTQSIGNLNCVRVPKTKDRCGCQVLTTLKFLLNKYKTFSKKMMRSFKSKLKAKRKESSPGLQIKDSFQWVSNK